MIRPTFIRDNVFDVDYAALLCRGVKNIIFDIDNTLITYDEDVANDRVRKLIGELSEKGFKMFILSNGHSERAKRFADDLGLIFRGDALKPLKRGYKGLKKAYGVCPHETVMIGDQLFTDIWGANRFKCLSVLVTPIKTSNEPGFVKFKRKLEKLMMKRILADKNAGAEE